MPDVENKRTIYCSSTMTLPEYTSLLRMIQANHSFPSIPDGANVKYVDSKFSISSTLDTRDANLFMLSVQLRGFGEVLFVKEHRLMEARTEESTYTDKPMYQSVLDYLEKHGNITTMALTAASIGRLGGMQCIFGSYSGRIATKSDVARFPFADFCVGRPSAHMFAIRSSPNTEERERLRGAIVFDEEDGSSVLYNLERKVVFRGYLRSQADMMEMMRLTNIQQSF